MGSVERRVEEMGQAPRDHRFVSAIRGMLLGASPIFQRPANRAESEAAMKIPVGISVASGLLAAVAIAGEFATNFGLQSLEDRLLVGGGKMRVTMVLGASPPHEAPCSK